MAACIRIWRSGDAGSWCARGRENYLCLLNYEDRVNGLAGAQGSAAVIPLGLLARWAMATADGDIAGGDLPGWFGELFGPAATLGLQDRRGECIHGACPHYKRCFVEHTIRRARSAELVVANHALVMIQAAHGFADGAAAGGLDGAPVPTRYVFDEGHHVFDAADSAFAAVFSGIEGAELRRWLLGAEGGSSRARGPPPSAGRAGGGASGVRDPAGCGAAGGACATGPGLVAAPGGGYAGIGWAGGGAGQRFRAVVAAGAPAGARPALCWPSRVAGRCWSATCIRSAREWRTRRCDWNGPWRVSSSR